MWIQGGFLTASRLISNRMTGYCHLRQEGTHSKSLIDTQKLAPLSLEKYGSTFLKLKDFLATKFFHLILPRRAVATVLGGWPPPPPPLTKKQNKQIIQQENKKRTVFANLFLKLCEFTKWKIYVRKKFKWLKMKCWIPQGTCRDFCNFRIKLFDGSELSTWSNFSVCFFSAM